MAGEEANKLCDITSIDDVCMDEKHPMSFKNTLYNEQLALAPAGSPSFSTVRVIGMAKDGKNKQKVTKISVRSGSLSGYQNPIIDDAYRDSNF